ncbi:fimbria/pilus outer membrane usher protein [Sphingomonas baiyangensis]|uniref:Fimbrial biogenesis outer membrane usher protein n=1 Tax=Sphingomonas baiyangensis TaxID=2572576 RepID=A0A4U1L8L9_9SPHN|nr:fimbria/pilus outer membrane usher protein [Sphingomonas baiyangensis]TKD53327.1 fimbrial biogenesis outer membrane usher protein [Sphingomonas baiyangensis]
MARWTAAAVLAALLIILASLADARAASAASQTLFVELFVNGAPRATLAELRIEDERMTMAASVLRDAGVAVRGEAEIDLAAAGFSPAYDALRQTLHLTVPAALLPISRRSGPARERVLADVATGAAFNYDAFVQTSGGRTSASLWSEARLFGAFGNLSTTGVVRAGSGLGNGYLRYDTRLRHVDADRALVFTGGDLITGAMAWTRPVRLGGVQIGRNFRSRPDLVTMPLPSFSGEAAVPSAVDLFIDGYRQQSDSVAPGRFVVDGMPVVSGAGTATIVTTDAVGRQVATSVPFYVAPDLLRPGLVDFSAEIGLVRKRYGLDSFAYGRAAASGFVRRGMTPRLTLEANGEWSERSAALGAGAVWMPGLFGTLSASVIASRADGTSGTQITAGYQYTGRSFSFAAEHRRRSDGFRTLADFDLRDMPAGGSSTRAIASLNLDRWGSIGAGYIDVKPLRGARARLATASWSVPVTRSAFAFVSADYDLDRRAVSGQFRIAFPLGGGSASTGVGRDRGRGFQTQAEYSRAAPLTGGIGINAGAAIDERGRTYGQGEAVFRTHSAQFTVGGSIADRRGAVWAGASGSVVSLDGGIFAANDVSDAFAVVSTGGIADVPVHYENQLVGKTDARGHLLIPRIIAYQPATVSIDPMKLEAGLMPTAVRRRIAVAEGAATVIAMPIRTLRSATIALVDDGGQPITAGAVATLADGTQSIVGWDGILYVEDVAQARSIAIRQPDGAQCRAAVADLDGAVSFDRREHVTCH